MTSPYKVAIIAAILCLFPFKVHATTVALSPVLVTGLGCARIREMLQGGWRHSSVFGLLAFGRPAAITRFVVAVVIDAVDAMEWGRFTSHICEKRFERTPSLTNGDSSATIFIPAPIFAIRAALDHTSPCVIFRPKSSACSGRTMLHVDRSEEASTTTSIATSKPCSNNHNFLAAFTSTIPSRLSTCGFCASPRNYSKAPKFLSFHWQNAMGRTQVA